MKTAPPLSRTRLEVIEAGGRLCQLLGVPRSTGQIYGLLYLWPKPLALDEIAQLLEISKASVSMGTRQLLTWRAIRQVWVHGERRDHFEIEPDLSHLIRAGYSDFLKPRLTSSHKRIEKMHLILEEEMAQGLLTREEYKLCAGRLKNFLKIQKKLQTLAPLAERLL